MSRPLRIEYPGAFYHTHNRGNGRQKIFYNSKDYSLFLDILIDTIEQYGWLCYGYCLMPNHYHILVETPVANLSQGMKHLDQIFTQKINYYHQTVGHVFQGRYKASLVEKQGYLGELVRYIALNPFRKKLVKKPEVWMWSSYSTILSGKSIFDEKLVLAEFDKDPVKAKKAMQKFVNAKVDYTDFGRQFKTLSILGSKEFLESVAEYLPEDRRVAKEIKIKDRLFNRPGLEKIINTSTDIKTRNKSIKKAYFDYHYKMIEIANYTELHYSSISRIINRPNTTF